MVFGICWNFILFQWTTYRRHFVRFFSLNSLLSLSHDQEQPAGLPQAPQLHKSGFKSGQSEHNGISKDKNNGNMVGYARVSAFYIVKNSTYWLAKSYFILTWTFLGVTCFHFSRLARTISSMFFFHKLCSSVCPCSSSTCLRAFA